jgi:murein DD-endopeptidase MepM/ murein hydrolase activator NlpD
MRRVDRVRWEKRRRLILTVGLAFTVGALTSGALIWRADRLADTPTPANVLERTVAPAPDPAPAAMATSGTTVEIADAVGVLTRRRLEMPVEGVSRDRLQDTFDDPRGGGLRTHEAIDIMAPRGTPVRAVEAGRVARLFRSIPGGLTVYLFDARETFAYYYAHLDRYAPGLEDGQQVQRGEVIGFVGSTGNASEDAPHLHFAIFQLDEDRKWWEGTPINPYHVLR